MRLLWVVYVFIFTLFSSFSFGNIFSYSDDSEGKEHWNNLIVPNETTTKSLILDELEEEHEDYDEQGKTIETTTVMKKMSEHHSDSDEIGEYGDTYADEEEEDKTSTIPPISTLVLSSSSSSSSISKIRLTTSIITETTTSESETPLTRSLLSYSNISYYIDQENLANIATDSEEKAAFLAKTKRDRLLLKMFLITVVISMFILAVTLITIHIVRKTKRYHGYRTPANASSNEESKHHTNVKL